MRTQRGFSLLEIMAVVAVIGVLLGIAKPMYEKFRIRAIQSEGKSELSAGYTAEMTFYNSYHTYNGNLCYIGFVPASIVFTNGTAAVRTGMRRYYGYSSGGGAGVAMGRADVNTALPELAGPAECFGAAFSGNCLPANAPGTNGWCAVGMDSPSSHTQTQSFCHEIWGTVSWNNRWGVGTWGDSWKIDMNRKIWHPTDGSQ